MRTTISIDDGLYDDLKRVANASGKSFSRLVAEMLREALAARHEGEAAPPFELVTYGQGGLRPGLSWRELSVAGVDEEDRQRVGLGNDTDGLP